MPNQNRETLKSYFKNGQMPTENSFIDLIDSVINKSDDGFDQSMKHGVHITSSEVNNALISFFRGSANQNALWTLELKNDNSLVLKKDSPTQTEGAQGNISSEQIDDDILAISPDGKVGINETNPQHALQVKGTIASIGREGKEGDKEIPADGRWHTILSNLDGCNAFEVMAGVGIEGTGKYALMHAFAVNAFHDKKKITYHQAYYMSRGNKIKMRWTGSTHSYNLEMKTLRDYKDENTVIRYSLTRLWSDPLMKKCRKGI